MGKCCGGCKASDLRYKIIIEQYTPTLNKGEEIKAWSTFATKRASVKYTSGFEGEKNDRETSMNTVVFDVRFDSTITAKMRINYDGSYHDIQFIKPDMKRAYMELIAKKVDG